MTSSMLFRTKFQSGCSGFCISPERYTHNFIERQEQARLTIVGRKLFKAPMQETEFIDKSILAQWYSGSHGGLHDVYVIEIENVYE